MLIDTFYYLADGNSLVRCAPLPNLLKIPISEINFHIKSGDLFQGYPQVHISQLPPDMPLSHREKLRALLPFTPVIQTVASLAYATRDPSSGALIATHAVQHRPWEWMEHLGETALVEGTEAERTQDERVLPPGQRPVKNAGSISLELFEAHATGDGLPDSALDDRARAAMHTFEDGLAADNLFQRDWREARLEPLDGMGPGTGRSRGEDADVLSALPTFPRTGIAAGRPESRPGSRGPSPTPSVFSRASSWQYGALGHAMASVPTSAATSLRASPAQPHTSTTASRASVSTTASGDGPEGELPQAVGPSARRVSKRKAQTVLDDDDDDVQIVDPPPRSATAKKTKGKTAAKTRSKR